MHMALQRQGVVPPDMAWMCLNMAICIFCAAVMILGVFGAMTDILEGPH